MMALRPPPLQHIHHHARHLHTTSPQRASVLFALGALSNSRETQHFNKASRLERVEHSPSLKLIQTSEVDPYPLPERPKAVVTLVRIARTSHALPARAWNARALAVGKKVLSDHARQLQRLSKVAEQAKRRELHAKASRTSELQAWTEERQKMRAEMRAAGLWIVLSVGTATGLAMWRFWPQAGVEGYGDSGEMGRRIAEKARSLMPEPSISERISAAVASPPIGVSGPVTVKSAVPQGRNKDVENAVVPAVGTEKQGSWWKSLFWKQ